MIDHDDCVLREATGTSGVLEAARLAAGRLANHLICLARRDGRKAGQ